MSHDRGGSSIRLDHPEVILQNITDGYFGLDEQWRFNYVNHQAEKVLGQDEAALLGRQLWEAFPGTVGSEFESLYRQVRATRTPRSFTSYYPDHQRWYEVHAYPSESGLSVYFRNATERVVGEQKLRESETRFRLMADSIPQIVWITDRHGNTEFFNRQWSIFTGEPFVASNAGEIVNRHVHPDDIALTVLAWEAAMRDGHGFLVEHRLRSATGEYRWFLVRAEPYRDSLGSDIVNWFGTSTDVHDQKTLEASLRRSEAQYRALFNSIDEGFCIIEVLFDADGRAFDYRFCEVNAPFSAQTGLHDAVGKTMKELAPGHEGFWFEVYGKVALTGEPIRFEHEADALQRWFDVYAFRVAAPGANKVAVLFKDISLRKRQDEETERAIRQRDEFLAMLAHELRNPLAPIGAAADLLRIGAQDKALVRQTSEVISRQVGHMTGLIDDLLDVSRVTRGQIGLELAPIDAKRVLSDAAEQVGPLMELRRHHLAVHKPPEPAWVAGDHKRLVQVVANVLNNAAKYTDAGGHIVLRLEVQPEHVMIAVGDNGVGIAPDFLEGVFDLFSQAQRSADRSQGGLGIGLALVKSLVELHGGEVYAHSAGIGQGSEFKICLPRIAAPLSLGAAPGGAAAAMPASALRLMVVDDNVDAASMLALYLRAGGHQVLVESDSLRALERAANTPLDALLIDIGLPGIDGNEMARRLRRQPATAGAMLIAVTGYGQEQDRKGSVDAGFDHHMVKPVDLEALAALLATVAAGKTPP